MRIPRTLRFLPALALVACSPTAPVATTAVRPQAAPQQAGQQLDDVVYLKDGSIIRGVIVEQRLGESVLIRTRDGNQFRYQVSAIERLTRESPIMASVPPRQVAPLVPFTPKSPGTAALLSALLPSAGQFYTGHWGTGIFYLVAMGWGYDEYAKGLVSDECLFYNDCSKANTWLGFLGFMYALGIVDAALGASSYNRKAQESASLSIVPWMEVGGASLSRRGASGVGAVPQPRQSNLKVGILRLRW